VALCHKSWELLEWSSRSNSLVVEVGPAEVWVKSHDIKIPMADFSPVKKTRRGVSGVVPPRPPCSLHSFLGDLIIPRKNQALTSLEEWDYWRKHERRESRSLALKKCFLKWDSENPFVLSSFAKETSSWRGERGGLSRRTLDDFFFCIAFKKIWSQLSCLELSLSYLEWNTTTVQPLP